MESAFINGEDFVACVKDSTDWTFKDTFNGARKEDDEAGSLLLAKFQTATMVNNLFLRLSVRDYTFIVGQSQEYTQFSVVGFVTQVQLGPYTQEIHKRNNMHPGRFIQSITITGLGDETFDKAVMAARHLAKFMQQSGPDIRPLDTAPTFAGQFSTIAASARLLTPAQYNLGVGYSGRTFEKEPVPRMLDPDTLISIGVSQGTYEYTSDNAVCLNKLLSSNPEDISWRQCALHSPVEIGIGNLVEIIVSFKVAPFSKTRKVMCHLEEVCRLSVEATSKLDERRETQATTAHLANMTVADVEYHEHAPKRRATGAAGVPKPGKRMQVDNAGA
ncbi:hypothetical protein C8F01DRAFT_731412 [Mycena amicta]|nr:hypothetical protein C8F01DRAFT_731412 [Mycena amicta]